MKGIKDNQQAAGHHLRRAWWKAQTWKSSNASLPRTSYSFVVDSFRREKLSSCFSITVWDKNCSKHQERCFILKKKKGFPGYVWAGMGWGSNFLHGAINGYSLELTGNHKRMDDLAVAPVEGSHVFQRPDPSSSIQKDLLSVKVNAMPHLWGAIMLVKHTCSVNHRNGMAVSPSCFGQPVSKRFFSLPCTRHLSVGWSPTCLSLHQC